MTQTPAPPAPLWHHRDFRRHLAGQAAGVAGSSISSMALPVLAVVQLDATTGQVATLAVLAQLPPALLALHAGALADWYPKRSQMITSNLVSAGALATVPVAAVLGTLTLTQLMAVAAVLGAAGVLHDAAAISLLPGLIDRSLIQRGNSRVGALFAVAATGGSNLGAALTALLGPARALLGDVVSYLVSAWCTARIQTRETAPDPDRKRQLRTEIAEGLRYVHADPRLSVLTWVNATTSLALALLNTLRALYLLRNLIGCALVLQQACAAAAGTTQRSIRQIVTEPRMQARMQAVSTCLTSGARPLGALLAGALGTWVGVRTALAVGALLLFVPFLVLARSPLRGLRLMPVASACRGEEGPAAAIPSPRAPGWCTAV